MEPLLRYAQYAGEMLDLEAVTPEWIRSRMQAKRLRQSDVAAEIGLDQHKLSKSLNGHRRFTRRELEALGRLLCDPLPQDAADPETAELLNRIANLPDHLKQVVRALVSSLEDAGLSALENTAENSDQAS